MSESSFMCFKLCEDEQVLSLSSWTKQYKPIFRFEEKNQESSVFLSQSTVHLVSQVSTAQELRWWMCNQKVVGLHFVFVVLFIILIIFFIVFLLNFLFLFILFFADFP